MDLSKEFRFEASHQLENYHGKCARLHGHSWKLTVFVTGDVNPSSDMVYDYAGIKELVQPIVNDLDHRHLGFGPAVILDDANRLITVHIGSTVHWIPYGFRPTSENLLWLIGRRIRETAVALPWSLLMLEETCTCSAALSREEFEQKGGFPYYGKAEKGKEGEGRTEERREKEADEMTSSLLITDDDIPF